jgi:hypothetical protein
MFVHLSKGNAGYAVACGKLYKMSEKNVEED